MSSKCWSSHWSKRQEYDNCEFDINCTFYWWKAHCFNYFKSQKWFVKFDMDLFTSFRISSQSAILLLDMYKTCSVKETLTIMVMYIYKYWKVNIQSLLEKVIHTNNYTIFWVVNVIFHGNGIFRSCFHFNPSTQYLERLHVSDPCQPLNLIVRNPQLF